MMKRKLASIFGGGLSGFAIFQLSTLLLITRLQVQRYAFIGVIIGLVAVSTFLGGIIAGVIDKGDAVTRGMHAALIALAINVLVNLVIGLYAVFPGFFSISIFIIIIVLFTIFIPIFCGAIGGKFGGSLRDGK